jgi:hypothetical protein
LLRNPQGVKPTEIQLLEQANDGRKMRMWSRGEDVEKRWGCGMEVGMWNGGGDVEWRWGCGMEVGMWNGGGDVEWR